MLTYIVAHQKVNSLFLLFKAALCRHWLPLPASLFINGDAEEEGTHALPEP